MIDIGQVALLLATVFSGYAAIAAYLSARWSRPALLVSARRSAVATLGLATLAVGVLVTLLLRRDFQAQYVYQHVSSTLSLPYTIAALWAGQEGSLLLWFWFLALFGVLLTRQRASWSRPLEPHALVVVCLTQAFFAFLLCWVSRPFVALPARPVEGAGLNPLLEHPAMVLHPPTLLFAYAAYTVPFAYALAALATGRLGPAWLRGIRFWNLLAWGALGLGILLGAWWAYMELGWGGYWGWDPVENASLVPWLTGTALLHSVMLQERRGQFKVWNLLLIAGTFLLCLFATFITRSGLIQSVHAFGASPIGYLFLGFIALLLACTLWLMWQRRAELRSEAPIEQVLSREATILLSNLLFTGMAGAVMLGTLFPALTGFLQGTPIALDTGFFERVGQPLSLALLLLLGICPLLGWRRSGGILRTLPFSAGVGLATSAILAVAAHVRDPLGLLAFGLVAWVATSVVLEYARGVRARCRVTGEVPHRALFNLFARNRRRYGGYIIHLAVVLMALGITGEALFKEEHQATLRRGQAVAVGPYQVRFEGLSSEMAAAKERHTASVGVYLAERRIATLQPEYNLHYRAGQYVSEVAIRSTLREDVYIAVTDIAADGSAVTLHVLLNPLMVWLWVGGVLMLLATAAALWPERSSMPLPAAGSLRRAMS